MNKGRKASAKVDELVNDGERVVRKGREAVRKTEEKVEECTDVLVKQIHANPIASVLVAAGVGYLLSRLLRK